MTISHAWQQDIDSFKQILSHSSNRTDKLRCKTHIANGSVSDDLAGINNVNQIASYCFSTYCEVWYIITMPPGPMKKCTTWLVDFRRTLPHISDLQRVTNNVTTLHPVRLSETISQYYTIEKIRIKIFPPHIVIRKNWHKHFVPPKTFS